MRSAMMLTVGVLVGSARAQPGWVLSNQKISAIGGGLSARYFHPQTKGDG